MKNIIFAGVVIAFLSACSGSVPDQKIPAGVHAVVVAEVLQTSQYTYLRVKEGDKEAWLAVSKMQPSVGETYYYGSSLPMKDFESKELNRTFSEVLFLDNLSTTPDVAVSNNPPAEPENTEAMTAAPIAHTVVAEEILQTSQYTYVKAKEGSAEFWLAAKKFDAGVGKTYYFMGGLPMTNFESKELKRTFPEVLFVDNISDTPGSTENNSTAGTQFNKIASKGSAIDLEKKEIKLKKGKDDITIASLLENKKSYPGKTIKIQGQVTKYTPGIMKRNWIHLQDGTEFSGKFDLTVTTEQEVKVGDIITVEGVISLDKDFGFGYFYEVILEDAKLLK